jgi:4-hydroxy-2-oxoheptanedioate aldolase
MHAGRPIRFKEKLQAGEFVTLVGGLIGSSSELIDFLGPLGFDGYWLEAEHGPVTWDQIGDISRTCDLWGAASLVRIHANEIGLITRTLDCGAGGVIVPHVNTKAEAEQVVQGAKFAPIGKRGFYTGRRSYGVSDYFQAANAESIVVVMIEEMEGIENLADILTVDHIDVFFVAPGDLAQSMGYVGQSRHPKVQEVLDQALRQIVAAGRVAGTSGFDEQLPHFAGLGVQVFSARPNNWLQAGATQYLARVADLKKS